MRKDVLKTLTDEQLVNLAHNVSREQLFREYQRKQKWLKKHPIKPILTNLTTEELQTIIED